jgi:hypothetical protein
MNRFIFNCADNAPENFFNAEAFEKIEVAFSLQDRKFRITAMKKHVTGWRRQPPRTQTPQSRKESPGNL